MNGAQLADEGVAGLRVAGDGARLDQRGALPVLAHALVIEKCGGRGDGDARRAGIGSEAKIGAEDVAVRRAFLEKRHQEAHDSDPERRRLGTVGAARAHPARKAR